MAGYVYLIGSRRFHWFKIGKSSRPTIRISELGILLPFKVEVIAIWNSLDHSRLERELHKKHRDDHINGEWFSFSAEQLEGLLCEMNPWNAGINSDFSNMTQDVIPEQPIGNEAKRLVGHLLQENKRLRGEKFPVKVGEKKEKIRCGFQSRIDRLIKENSLLREQLQALSSGATIQ